MSELQTPSHHRFWNSEDDDGARGHPQTPCGVRWIVEQAIQVVDSSAIFAEGLTDRTPHRRLRHAIIIMTSTWRRDPERTALGFAGVDGFAPKRRTRHRPGFPRES